MLGIKKETAKSAAFNSIVVEQLIGIREVADQVWQVSFMDCDLGYFDQEQDRVEPGLSPFEPAKSVNHVSGIRCKPCDRNTP